MTEAADRLLATSIEPFLGLADTFFNAGANFHRFGCWGLRLRGAAGACPGRRTASVPAGRARLRQPGQSETARREEVVLQKFLDAFRLGAMVDKLPWKALVEFQRVALRTMLRIVNGQHIGPLGIHPVTVGTCQGFPVTFLIRSGVRWSWWFSLMALVSRRAALSQLDPRFLLILPRYNH